MKVFVSVDIEGVAGVVDSRECVPGDPEHDWARRLMGAEAAAAVDGALAAGATEVVVNDAHDGMHNILPDALDPRASLIRGELKPLSMLQGLEAGFDAALFVGYHARAGTRDAVLAHTFTGPRLQEARLNGRPAGEILLNASLAAELGVPVVLVAGDAAAAREAEADIPGVRTVAVKEAAGTFAARCLHPEESCRRIRAAAEQAVRGVADVAPLPRAQTNRLETRWRSPAVAQLLERIPQVELLDERTVSFESASMREVYGVLLVQTTIAGSVGDRDGYA
jgi:D-amino peptidase